MDTNTLKRFDRQNMHKVYDAWPETASGFYGTDLPAIDLDEISHVVFAGMGGSGTIGDVFSAILSKTAIHVDVVKGYQLPRTVSSKSLVVTTSISGNTEETLNVLARAASLGCQVAAFSSGGRMEEFCAKKGINYRKIPMVHSSRASFPAYMFSILRVLESFLPVMRRDITDSLKKVQETGERISSSNLCGEKPGHIPGPVAYRHSHGILPLGTAGSRNKIQELAAGERKDARHHRGRHRGMPQRNCVLVRAPSGIRPILIHGADDHQKTKERWAVLKEFFAERGIEHNDIHSVDGNILGKMINLIYLLDYSTIYRAVMSGTDPTPVEPIEFIKRRLADLRLADAQR